MEGKRRKFGKIGLPRVLFAVGVFVFLLIFFLGYRPLTLDNMDDWTYISFTRRAVPIWNYWNPSRILPEILMPLSAQLGVWFVMPFVHDYVSAVNIALNVVLCLTITLYICAATYWLEKMVRLDFCVTMFTALLFLILHFKSWMSPWIPSQHLFFSGCPTTCYYYTIPALVNIVLVLLTEAHQNGRCFWQDEHLILKGGVVAAVYLAVFSNLFASVILVVYALCVLLESIAGVLVKKERIGEWFQENALHIGVILMGLVSAVFELSGGRSRSVGNETTLIDQLKATVIVLLETIEKMEDTTFWLCFILIVAGLAVAWVFDRKENAARNYLTLLFRHLFCAGVTLAALIILSVVSYPAYIERMDVLIGVMFHVLLAAVLSLGYLLGRWKKLILIIPLTVFILGFDVLYGIESFTHSTTSKMPAKVNVQVNRILMQEILEADRQGLESVTIRVPLGDADMSNWPYTTHMGGRMIETLYHHGMIENLKRIYVEPDSDFYSAFDIKR